MQTTLTKDIVETAQAAGSFSTLVTALTEAGLVETLKGAGPFTVFAPSDEAFKKVSQSDLEALLKDKAKLTKVLTYHVVSGNVVASSLTEGQVVTTLQSGTFTIGLTGGAKITDFNNRVSNIVATDVQAGNGVVHVIDKVLLPQL